MQIQKLAMEDKQNYQMKMLFETKHPKISFTHIVDEIADTLREKFQQLLKIQSLARLQAQFYLNFCLKPVENILRD